MTTLTVLLDTNVLVSAFLVKQGKPAHIFAQRDRYELILSTHILGEVHEALGRRHIQKRFHPSRADIRAYVSDLHLYARLIDPQPVENVIPQDPPDNLVLASAAGGKANYLVTGNKHLLELKEYRGVKIVTPAQFLEILAQLDVQDTAPSSGT
jgi:putative PIN family toxin of toxin-antitoxin system